MARDGSRSVGTQFCGVAMSLPRPVDRFSGDRTGNTPLVELSFGFAESVTAFDERQGQSTSSTSRRFVGTLFD